MIALLAGLLGGGLHTLSGPDHLAALGPLCTDGGTRPWRAGLRWGLGHGGGVLAIAGLTLLLRERLPLARVEWLGERLVGAALCAVGVLGLVRLLRTRVRSRLHRHDGVEHTHFELERTRSGAHSHAALLLGGLHGLAGGSHLLAVLPALALTSVSALIYLAGFVAGSTAAMALFSAALGRCARPRLQPFLLAGSSLAAIAIGALWLTRAPLA